MKKYIEPADHTCDECGVEDMEYVCTHCFREFCKDCAEDHACEG